VSFFIISISNSIFSAYCSSQWDNTLALAENKTCTITNARRGTIIVGKPTNPDGAPGSFTFTEAVSRRFS
jgi:hypothetical protein